MPQTRNPPVGLDRIVEEEPGLVNCDYVPEKGTADGDE